MNLFKSDLVILKDKIDLLLGQFNPLRRINIKLKDFNMHLRLRKRFSWIF